MRPDLPIIDIAPLVARSDQQLVVAHQIHDACRQSGFFYITGHGVSERLLQQLDRLSRKFFALDIAEKMRVRMALAGQAWRGYFPLGDELTSGKPDLKEGLYFGEELPEDDRRIQEGLPMQGQNLFPSEPVGLGKVVLEYLDTMNTLGHHLMRGISLSLGLDESYFHDAFTSNPLILFRIFHYPHQEIPTSKQWGVGEHTDYGLLTILKQDSAGGLQIKSKAGWIDAPPLEGTFICNIGDMLDRLTRGYYRSTPHRVLNKSGKGRLSFPFFFDPGFDARLEPVPLPEGHAFEEDMERRWDGQSVHDFEGTYGDYILGKVGKVFPGL